MRQFTQVSGTHFGAALTLMVLAAARIAAARSGQPPREQVSEHEYAAAHAFASARHNPLLQYVAAGVPVALATDDEGASRIDLTHEYVRAVSEAQWDLESRYRSFETHVN